MKNQNCIKTALKLRHIFCHFFLEVRFLVVTYYTLFAKCYDFLVIHNVIQQLGDKRNMNSDNILMSLVDMAKETQNILN